MSNKVNFLASGCIALILWLGQTLFLSNLPRPKSLLPYKVERLFILSCVDGDTCSGIDSKGIKKILRLRGVDATELSHSKNCRHQSFAIEAKDYINRQIKGQHVLVLLYDRGPYKRYIADIYQHKTPKHINHALVQQGWTFAYRMGNKKRPELEWAEKAERFAQKNKKGLWALSKTPQTPWLTRKLKLNCLQN